MANEIISNREENNDLDINEKNIDRTKNFKKDEKQEDKRNRRQLGELPNKIRFYRKKYGYTQRDLEQKWEKSQQAISKYETGEYNLKPEEIKKVLLTFPNLSYDEIWDTGRLSVCINKRNDELLQDYISDLKLTFPKNTTEHEKANIIVNHILKIFLSGNLSMELKDSLAKELEE